MCHRRCPAGVSLEDLASDLGGKNSEGWKEDSTEPTSPCHRRAGTDSQPHNCPAPSSPCRAGCRDSIGTGSCRCPLGARGPGCGGGEGGTGVTRRLGRVSDGGLVIPALIRSEDTQGHIDLSGKLKDHQSGRVTIN